MTTNPYQVLGPTIPVMLGRQHLVKKAENRLLKATPDHVSVVGPTRYGKSVFVHHLAEKYRTPSTHYLTSVYTDLRHQTPRTDTEFQQRLAREVKAALTECKPDLAGYIELTEGIYDTLLFCFDELEKSNEKLLVVLDGFDHVLSTAELTRNLWDQMRSLGQKRSLLFLTASRRPLRELCKTEESRTSDFWEIFFDTPIVVGAFDALEVDDVVKPFVKNNITFDSSAKKELLNWTGGIPVLVAALLRELFETLGTQTTCSKKDIDTIAERFLEETQQLLQGLWDDCHIELRNDLVDICMKGGLGLGSIPEVRQRALRERGLGLISGNQIQASCRLVERFIEHCGSAATDLRRLFGTLDSYEKNIQSLLELRFSQIAGRSFDSGLTQYVEHGIRAIQTSPELSLSLVRGICSQALSLVWKKELGLDQTIPNEWIEEFERAGIRRVDHDGKLPSKPGLQCHILKQVTGTENTKRVTKYVTKQTYLLINHLQAIGDFAQHYQQFPERQVTIGFSASVIHTAIELVEQLARDLQ